MNKIMAIIKRNLYFSLTILVLAAALAFSAATFALLGFGNNDDQTSVGHLYLGEYEQDQYGTILTQKINSWKIAADYKMTFQGYELPIDLDLFDFDVTTTVNQIVQNELNSAYFTLSEANQATLVSEISVQFTAFLASHFDFQQFLVDVNKDLSSLKSKKTYDFIDYLDPAIYDNELNSVDVTQINETDVDAIVDFFSQIDILAHERFSLLTALADYDLSNEQKSIIASAIEALSLNTSFSGYIFQQYTTLPSWAESGMNVRILQVSGTDFSFYNDMAYDFKIIVEKVGETTLRFKLLGIPYITSYSTEAVISNSVAYETLYVEDLSLNAATPNVVIVDTLTETTYTLLTQAGENGQVITFVRTITPLGGTPMDVVLFGEQVIPVNEIILEHVVSKVGD